MTAFEGLSPHYPEVFSQEGMCSIILWGLMYLAGATFHFKTMNCAFKMMDCALKLMDFVLKILNSRSGAESRRPPTAAARLKQMITY